MNRVFLSLYLLVVVSVIVVGWGTDKLWEMFNQEPETTPFESALFSMIETQLKEMPVLEASVKVQELNKLTEDEVELFSLEDLAQSPLTQQMEEGEIVSLFDAAGRRSSYKRIKNSTLIIRVTSKEKQKEQNNSYLFLIIVFYFLIGIVIYFWVWPLSRDLRKLQTQTQQVGLDGVPNVVEMSPSSAVYSLATAFNNMVERIHDLLASHKEMTYAVSHELRTPLARMKFALAMAKDASSPEMKEKQMDSVAEDVAEMDRLINELMAYAGFEMKNHTLDLQAGELPVLVENLMSAQSDILKESNGLRKYSIENKMGNHKVYCAWYLMECCLQNLIQNAFKYSHSKIKVTLEYRPGVYIFAIEDDGDGISEDDFERVFNPFVRLPNAEQSPKSGFGLGLALVKRIVKWHSGRIELERSPLGGAKFIVKWPETLPKV